MKFILAFLLLAACSHKPKLNMATLSEPTSKEKETLANFPPLTAQYEFEGYKVAAKECTFVRTMYLELTPKQTGAFEAALNKRIEPKTIFGVDHKKQKGQTNPCSRLRIYKNLNEISFQGSKNKTGDKGYLVKATLGETPKGQAYLNVEFFQRLKKDETVRVMNPGYFISYEMVQEMTNDELAEWIVTTLYHVGWK